MKKILGLFLFSLIVFTSNKSFCQIDTLAKTQLDTLIYKFVRDIRYVKNLTPEEELKKLEKGLYETTREFNSRKNQIIKDFSTYQKDKLNEYFNVYSSKNILAIVKLDSVKFDPDKNIASVFHRNIKIPNDVGNPYMDCFVYPALYYPFAWKTKEGFGLKKSAINLARKIARDNDIIRNKGVLEYSIKFFRGKNSMPSLRVTKVVWKIKNKSIWSWRGNTSIPKGINDKVLRGID